MEKISLMGGDNQSVQKVDRAWITYEDYSLWLNESAKNVVDPKIIYVAGKLSADGHFTLSATGVSDGYLTDDLKGDLSIEGVDANGSTIQKVTIGSRFAFDEILADGSLNLGKATCDYTPIVASIPSDTRIRSIVIKKASNLVVKLPIATLSLKEIIRLIPTASFKFSPSASQFILTLEANCIQRLIDKKLSAREVVRLLNLMEEEIKLGLKDQYKLSSPDQLEKRMVIDAIEALKGNVH